MERVSENNELLEAAYEYAARGWHVLPLHTVVAGACSCGNLDCNSPGKHPRNHMGSRGASVDQKQINDWWYTWPDANIGISTGTASNLAVIDADGTEGLSSLTHLNLRSSIMVETGSGGRHLYYQYKTGLANSAKKLAPGIDVRGEGGYVVAPPSVHASGERYSVTGWGMDQRLGDFPLEAIPSAQEASYEPTEASGQLDDTIPAGQRNETLMSIGGSMRRRGLGEEEIYAALSEVNRRRCQPRLRDTEIRSISRSSSRYRPEDPIPNRGDRGVRIQVQTAFELCSITLPDQDELVGPILVRGNRLLIAGHTGEGKTTFALQLVRSYVGGDRFLKWNPCHNLGRALVIDAEQGLRTIQRRLAESNLSTSQRLDYIRVPDGLNLDSLIESDQIEEVLATKNYGVVVLDPLYKLHKGELTDERVAVDLMRRLDRWRERYHFALVLLAHCRKPAPGMPFTIHDVFGSTAVSRGAEIILGLQRTGEGTSRLHFFKDRDGDLPIGDQWELTFDQGKGGYQSPLHISWQNERAKTETSTSTHSIDSDDGGTVIDFNSYRDS